MQLKNQLSISLLTVFSFAQAAHAWPLGRLFHWHPTTAAVRNSEIYFQLSNGSDLTQEVEVSGGDYALTPKSTLTLAATAGTPVISQSAGKGHREGEILFTVQPTLRNKTVIMH
jgi:hypothetical protein